MATKENQTTLLPAHYPGTPDELARQLHLLEKQQLLLLDNYRFATALFRHDVHIYCNQAYAELFGITDRKRVLGKSLFKLIKAPYHSDLAKMLQEINTEQKTEQKKAQNHSTLTLHVGRQEATALVTFRASTTFFRGESCLQITALPAVANSGHSQAKQQSEQQDLLTRLDSGSLFTSRVESAIAAAMSDNIVSIVLVVRIEDFAKLQEALGKPGTNQILNDISEFLKTAINKPFTASRLADNEFGLLLHNTRPRDGQMMREFLATRLSASLKGEKSATADIQTLIGIAVVNRQSLDARDVINKARLNTDADTQHNGVNVQQVLEQDRLTLLFQPVISYQPQPQQIYEALLRVKHSTDSSPVAPAPFLAQAQLHNLAEEIDKRILTQLYSTHSVPTSHAQCQNAAKLVFVHINGATLVNKHFLTWLSDLLRHHRSSSLQPVFQLSETYLHHNREVVREFCQGLDELGIPLAINHFGSVLEPLATLKEFSPAFVKLDNSLVCDLLYSDQQQRHVKKLIRAIHHEKVQVVVTAIEELELLPIFCELGVDLVQGHCVQAPAPTMAFIFPHEESICTPDKK